jgi:predicted DsbA family dithiol-disulfide isomerase
MRIEIWADLVCGWAYVAKRRIERALADWPGEPPELHWRPYRIDPTAPERPVRLGQALQDPQVAAALASCGPDTDEAPAVARMRAAAAAADEGIGPRFGAAWRVDPTDAHRLVALAYRQGGAAVQDRVVEALLHAHFVAGDPISDPAVLARIATDAGLTANVLADGAGADEVTDALLVGRARGIVASPTIVVGRFALRGAQPPEAILDLLRHAHSSDTESRDAETGDIESGDIESGDSDDGPVERYRWAESLLAGGDPLGALRLLAPVLAEHREPAVLELAGRAYFASAQLGRAEAVLRELVAARPDDAYGRLLLGRTLQRQGRADDAESELRLAAAMDPGYGDAMASRANRPLRCSRPGGPVTALTADDLCRWWPAVWNTTRASTCHAARSRWPEPASCRGRAGQAGRGGSRPRAAHAASRAARRSCSSGTSGNWIVQSWMPPNATTARAACSSVGSAPCSSRPNRRRQASTTSIRPSSAKVVSSLSISMISVRCR